jgi:hypothetical protein
MPNDRIDVQDVTDALTHRHTTADAETREALRRLATGVLRQLHSGAFGDFDPLRDLLGIDEKAECAQRVVDWYLVGDRGNPPFAPRPEMRVQMGVAYQEATKTPATDAELDVLAKALAGAEPDLFLAALPAQRMGLARTLVDDFVNGAG